MTTNEFLSRITILITSPSFIFFLLLFLVGIAFFLIVILHITKDDKEDFIYLTKRLAKISLISFLIMTTFLFTFVGTEVTKTSKPKQIFSNNENINLTFHPKENIEDPTVYIIRGEVSVNNMVAEDLEKYKITTFSGDSFYSLSIVAKKDNDQIKQDVYILPKDVTNKSGNKKAKLVKLEIYTETTEKIYLFKNWEKEKETYLKPTFELDEKEQKIYDFLNK